jgi:hypothetical protein
MQDCRENILDIKLCSLDPEIGIQKIAQCRDKGNWHKIDSSIGKCKKKKTE